MCGLTGIWGYTGKPVKSIWLDEFTDSLSHRGPDGRGVRNFQGKNLGLGHRRLSILDTTDAGAQPMGFADGRYQIVYNGEIYNFVELRLELERLGYKFLTRTDTEVILGAYHCWGEKCQEKFNGMWAFAIFDLREEKVFLSRDRFGVKPLFYGISADYFVFASELKAFLALPRSLQPKIDPAVVAWLTNVEDDHKTILKGVNNLNAGYCLTLTRGGGIRRSKWWITKDHLVDIPRKYGERVEHYRSLFLDACRIRMRSDVPIATALSGGLDSSSIFSGICNFRKEAAPVARAADDWQNAFFLDFLGSHNDEREYAEVVCDEASIDLTVCKLDPSQISVQQLADCIFSLEAIQHAEPGLGPWLLYKKMRNDGIVVSLDGHGGDETVAGYDHYPKYAMKEILGNPFGGERWDDLARINASFKKNEPQVSRAQVAKLFRSGAKHHLRAVAADILGPTLINRIKRIVSRVATQQSPQNDSFLQISRARRESPAERLGVVDRARLGSLNAKLYDDFHKGTLPRILRNFDRLSMANGVESRAPFLDWRLVCFAFSLPADCKLGGGYSKRILRDSMAGILPEVARLRRSKIGFASPLGEWLVGGLSEYVLDTVTSRGFIESDIWLGRKIGCEMERSISAQDFNQTEKLWKFVQAHSLLGSFDIHRNSRLV
jgi:asparagine synthase (glutamine-hydrolysing)